MTAIVDHKWGGLARRYEEFRRGTHRSIDPVESTRIAFPTALFYENWLLRRFDPAVDKVFVSSRITFGPPGQVVAATPDLDIHFVDGRRLFDQVVKDGAIDEVNARRLRKLAAYLDCEHAMRTASEIRRDPKLIHSLRHLRQAMVAYDGLAEETMTAIAKFLRSHEETTVGELRAKLADFEDEQIDAALGHMHVSGTAHLQLNGIEYGRHVIVRSL